MNAWAAAILLGLLLMRDASAQTPLGPAFTHQGRLENSGPTVNLPVDRTEHRLGRGYQQERAPD